MKGAQVEDLSALCFIETGFLSRCFVECSYLLTRLIPTTNHHSSFASQRG